MSHPVLRLYDGYKNTSLYLKEEVCELQKTLVTRGYAVQDSGLFDAVTESVVKRFQSDNGLDDDGVVGPATWSALLHTKPPDPDDVFLTTHPTNDTSLVEEDIQAKHYRQIVAAAARKFSIPVSIVVGVGSRESRWGLALKPHGPGGTGDFQKRVNQTSFRMSPLPPDGKGFGRGLMQIDFDGHPFARTGGWQDPKENINYGCQVLAESRDFIQQRTSLEGHAIIRAALAGYNAGAQNAVKAITAGYDIDFYTAGRDYSKDVLDRAGWFQLRGWV